MSSSFFNGGSQGTPTTMPTTSGTRTTTGTRPGTSTNVDRRAGASTTTFAPSAGTGTGVQDIYVDSGRLDGTNLILNLNDGRTVTIDLSGLPGGGSGGQGTTYTFTFDNTNRELIVVGANNTSQRVSIPVGPNTTYTMDFDGNTDEIILNGSDGSRDTVDLSSLDNNTRYTLDFLNNMLRLVPNDGGAIQSVEIDDRRYTLFYTPGTNGGTINLQGVLHDGTSDPIQSYTIPDTTYGFAIVGNQLQITDNVTSNVLHLDLPSGGMGPGTGGRTYTLNFQNGVLTFMPSDGNPSRFTIPNTQYTLQLSGDDLTLNALDSSNDTTVRLPDTRYSFRLVGTELEITETESDNTNTVSAVDLSSLRTVNTDTFVVQILISGNQLSLLRNDGQVIGPVTLPSGGGGTGPGQTARRTYQGVWAMGAQYQFGDIVLRSTNGLFYIATGASIGGATPETSSDWMVLAGSGTSPTPTTSIPNAPTTPGEYDLVIATDGTASWRLVSTTPSPVADVRPNLEIYRSATNEGNPTRQFTARSTEGAITEITRTVRNGTETQTLLYNDTGNITESVYQGPLAAALGPDSNHPDLLHRFQYDSTDTLTNDYWVWGAYHPINITAHYEFYPDVTRNQIVFRNEPTGSITQSGRTVTFDDTVFTINGRDVQWQI